MSVKELGKQSIIYGTGHVLVRSVTLLLLPFLTDAFSPAEYGYYSLAYAFMGFAMILYRYGMDTALMKFYIQSKNPESYFSTIFIIQFITASLFSGLLIFFSPSLSPIILDSANTQWLKLMAVIMLFDTLWGMSVLILRAEEKPYQFIGLNLLNVIITFALTILFVNYYQTSVEGVLLANLYAAIAVFIFTLPLLYQKISFKSVSRKIIKKVILFGLPLLPAGLFTMIMELADRYILIYLTDAATVGIYSAGYKLGLMGLLLVMGFNMGWTPYFLKRGNETKAPEEFAFIATILLGVISLVGISVTMWISEIVQIDFFGITLIDPSYSSALLVVPIILMGYYFLGTYVLQLPAIYIPEQTKWIPIYRGIGAGINVGLNFLFIPIYGIVGAAWATVISFLTMSTVVFFKTRSSYKIPFNIRSILLPFIIWMLIYQFPIDNNYIRLLINILLPFIWYLLILDAQEKTKLTELIS